MKWRWIENGAFNGATNMALDWVLLNQASIANQPAVRIYTWQPYCISIGYHQSAKIFDTSVCKKKQVDIVRRPTGGRAVFHAEEVTYSVMIPRTHALSNQSVTEIYHQISHALSLGLSELGLPVEFERQKPDLRKHYEKDISASCFSASALHEILIDRKKLVGSAQRRVENGLLQHGSILLGDAHLQLPEFYQVPEDKKTIMKEGLKAKTVTIQDYLQTNIGIDTISKELKKGFEKTFSVQFEDNDIQAEELKKADVERGRWGILSS